jgi:hypothetical protein
VIFLFQLQNPDDKIYTSEKGNKAKCFLKVVNSKSAWCMLHFLMDVLTVLVDVSKQFQEKTATISRILVTIEVAVEQITKLQTRFDNFALMACINNYRFDLIFGILTPLSTIFQLYHGDQF